VGDRVHVGCVAGGRVHVGCVVGDWLHVGCVVGNRVCVGCVVGDRVCVGCIVGNRVCVGSGGTPASACGDVPTIPAQPFNQSTDQSSATGNVTEVVTPCDRQLNTDHFDGHTRKQRAFQTQPAINP